MSAEVLKGAVALMRASADEMRHPMTPRDADFLEAVANLLEPFAADETWRLIQECGITTQPGSLMGQAIDVARAYLGGDA